MRKNRIAMSASFLILLTISSALAGSLPFDKAEYTARRAQLMAKIPDGIAVIWGSPAGTQNNELLYFCGVKVPRAVLVVDGIRKESLLFYTTTENFLKGEGLSVDLARDPKGATGVERCYPAEQFSSILSRLAGQAGVIYTPFRAEVSVPEVSSLSEWDGRLTRELRFVKLLKERFPQIEVRDCSETIWEIRRIKTPAEIDILRKTGRIGVQAMIEVMKAGRPGQYEYELSSLFEYACKKEGCPSLAFDVIISSAENHPYLHYAQHNRKLVDGDFLVVDAGPEFQDYDIDITISFPINGKFSPRQREIYEASNEVSKACLSLYKPGLTGYEIGEKVKEMLKQKGYDLTKDAFTRLSFFKEGGLTHHVGLATHDAGGRDLNYGAPLKPGQVFASDVFAVFPGENLGVRVENTVLVTDTGCENLTPGIPREISEIEVLMKRQGTGKAVK
jgi:Xaa-Pro aminopeptidase